MDVPPLTPVQILENIGEKEKKSLLQLRNDYQKFPQP